MNMVRFIAPVAALVALAACGGETEDADGKSADAAPPPARAEPTPSALDAIPMNFRGGWDRVDAGEFACTTLSDTALTIEPKLLQYYEGAFTPETISQISDDRIECEGFFQYADDRSRESYTLKLSDGGKRLTLSGDGFEPFEFRKCATIREAHLVHLRHLQGRRRKPDQDRADEDHLAGQDEQFHQGPLRRAERDRARRRWPGGTLWHRAGPGRQERCFGRARA